MSRKRLLILGGYGNTGRLLAELLLKYSDARLILAGRSLEKAEAVALALNGKDKNPRVTPLRLDAADPFTLRQAFKGVDMVVVASSTARYTENIASEALKVGIDYFDVVFSNNKSLILKKFEERIKKTGLCFITDGGFHPGLPGVMVRHLGAEFDHMHTARVGSVIQIDWKSFDLSETTAIEMVEEFRSIDMKSFRNGRWVKPGLKGPEYIRMDFGAPFYRRSCVSMYLEEMGKLPTIFPDLVDTGFYVGSFNWFVDYVVMMLLFPILWLFPKLGVKPMSRLMVWGLNTFTKPPFGTLLRCEASGVKSDHPLSLALTLSHPDGYYFTAAPAAACLLQYLDGSIRKPGLHTQAILTKPHRLIKDLKKMGIEIKLETSH
ncbi:MAG: saccharopine dehydrogenase NADP-binding domain-containing protein [Anaerolineaceae bacterium]|nr:saccharopine dehydrogenase NADP-binding domain-containing protein [Anaerolineaceae bacterium]